MDKKQKIKKILFWVLNICCYIWSALFFAILIVSCASRPQKNNNQANNLYKPHEILNVSYDDSTQIIILNANELNNYVFVNLNNLFDELYIDGYRTVFSDSFILYNSDNLLFEEIVEEYIFYAGDNYSIEFSYGYDNVNDGRFSITYNEDVISFEYDLEWQLPSLEIYTQVKNAIEKDIAYNQNPLDYSIFDGLSDGIINFVDTLNVGITNIVTIFYASGNLTPIGLLTVIVVAVSLVWFVFRLVIGLIRLRG